MTESLVVGSLGFLLVTFLYFGSAFESAEKGARSVRVHESTSARRVSAP